MNHDHRFFFRSRRQVVVSDAIRELIADVDIDHALSVLSKGQYLQKYCLSRFNHVRSILRKIKKNDFVF
jgi:hypothetical protein